MVFEGRSIAIGVQYQIVSPIEIYIINITQTAQFIFRNIHTFIHTYVCTYKHTLYMCMYMYILYIYIYVNDTYVNKYVGKRGHEFAGQQGKAYGGFGLRK